MDILRPKTKQNIVIDIILYCGIVLYRNYFSINNIMKMFV